MSKEHAYAYEAGYRDGSINYELEHCPACKNVADLQEALAENAKLREQGARLFDKTLELGTENAKLRELLEAVQQCAGETKRDKGCDACPMYNGPWRNDGTWCLLRPTLRELGVDE